MTNPLIDVQTLAAQINEQSSSQLCILDCRFDLAVPDRGRHEYDKDHIPGAKYAALHQDLAGCHIPGKTGRHPLPSMLEFSEKLEEWGITEHTTIICYDDGDCSFAARAWWLLHWAGLNTVQVLNGGFTAWKSAELPLERGKVESTALRERQRSNQYMPQFRDEMIISVEEILQQIFDTTPNAPVLIDARSPERYRGEQEPIDELAGHIPTAICIPYANNLDENGHFKSAAVLRERFAPYATHTSAIYCGSGVTACHNILSCAIAELPWPRLFPGSWSEWITQLDRPMILGQDPHD
jgi:thiosulfate/3-mercaptopyruvate sulfurtransferase